MANEAFMEGFGKGKDTAQKKKPATNPTKMASPTGFKKGGKVKKTGMAKVHRGEVVLTKSEAKKGHVKTSKKKSTHKKISKKK